MWLIGMFGTCIDIAINVIEKANMASLNDIKCSNLTFLDESLAWSLFNLHQLQYLR